MTGAFKDLNALAVEQFRSVPVEDMLTRLQSAQADLRRDYNLAQGMRIAFRQGSKLRPYPDAIELIDRHIRSHLERLKKGRR